MQTDVPDEQTEGEARIRRMSETGMRYLLEAVSAGSMRAAGDRLNIAPSSISRQIAQLESQFGLALVEKGRRGVRLTGAGEIVVAFYRNQLLEREVLQLKLDDLRSVRTGQVTVAVGEGFLGASFTGLITRFSKDNPLINLKILAGSSQEIMRMVSDDKAHLGLVFQTPHDPKIHVRSVIGQPLTAIMRPEDPLARRDAISIRDLAAQPLCLPPAHFRIRQILAVAEARTNCLLEPLVTTDSIHLMQDMVRQGVALTVLPQVGIWSDLEGGTLVSVPIADDAMEETTVSVILRSGRQLEGASMRMLKRFEAQLRDWNKPIRHSYQKRF